jgi:hypothetical protein
MREIPRTLEGVHRHWMCKKKDELELTEQRLTLN